MKLYKLDYKENFKEKKANSWEVKGLIFGDLNLIVGKNATGKTRVVRLISNIAKIIRTPNIKIPNGEKKLKFTYDKNKEFIYEYVVESNKIIKELIIDNGEAKLQRNNKTEIYSETGKKEWVNIDPPERQLVLHVRRDKKEYPFLEKLIDWANSVKGFYFGNTHPDNIEIPKDVGDLNSLSIVPSVLNEMSDKNIKEVIQDFNRIGYNVENVKSSSVKGLLPNIKMIFLKEKDLKFSIDQPNLSQGMFRAFSLLVIIQHIINSKKEFATILVDDLCEGLDYARSINFTKLLFNKLKNQNIQLIVTSNDSFLMDAVDIKYWNILCRKQGMVKASNYKNSREVFDDFKFTGLNNFDLLSSDFLNQKTK